MINDYQRLRYAAQREAEIAARANQPHPTPFRGTRKSRGRWTWRWRFAAHRTAT
jgi:hypothetical protein